jgi:hypothetical protein
MPADRTLKNLRSMPKFPYALPFAGFLILWTFVLFVMFDLRRKEVGSTTDSTGPPPCLDAESCMSLHLHNDQIEKMISQRCKLGLHTKSMPRFTKITLTHIPKSGGTSVKEYLNRCAPGRLRKGEHEHFAAAAASEPENIMVTIFREPLAKAISFYSYVNDALRFPESERGNQLWEATYRKPPIAWSEDPVVQRILQQDPVALFLRNVANASDLSSRLTPEHVQKLSPVQLKTIVTGTLSEYLSYTTSLPSEYQCEQHLEVAFVLLKHYEVVGTLERSTDFYKILNRRAQIAHSEGQAHEPMHLNRSKYKHKALSKADLAAMEANLRAPLYCATVLWRIAGKISDADAACPA